MKNRTSSPSGPQSRARTRLRWPALAGLAAAAVLTAFAATAPASSRPSGAGLTEGFAATWMTVTVVVFIIAAVTASRRTRRRLTQAGAAPAARRGRRVRRAAARGWEKA